MLFLEADIDTLYINSLFVDTYGNMAHPRLEVVANLQFVISLQLCQRVSSP